MATPSSHIEPPDSGVALSSAYPGFARRLEKLTMQDETDMSASHPYPHHVKKKRPSFFKRVESYVSSVLKLGRTYRTVKDTSRHLEATSIHLGDLDRRLAVVSDDMASLRERGFNQETQPEKMAPLSADQIPDDPHEDMRELRSKYLKDIDYIRTEISETALNLNRKITECEAEQAGLARAYSDLTRRLDLNQSDARSTPVPELETAGLDALTESFYARLEDRFRGSREEIKKRLVKYLPDAEAATERTGKPILDLGCGRGEWLETLSNHGLTGTGIDLNEMQLREARNLGLDVRLGDACKFLAEAESDSYGMITAHHLAEHLPFKTLVWMTREALRVLAPGGVLLYETPNPRNILVGASTFYIDPTHVRPLPAEVLTTLLDTVGFDPVESRFLHQSPTYDAVTREKRLDPYIAELLFGPQDLAVLGVTPKPTA